MALSLLKRTPADAAELLADGTPGSDVEPSPGALKKWWLGLALRERRMVAAAAIVVVAALLWMLFSAPPLKTIKRVPAEIEQAELQLQAMQRLAGEARELRSATAVPPDQAAAALRTATTRLGDKARLALQGDRAVLTLNGITSQALRDWITEARSGARARPLEANLTRNAQGLTGTLVVGLGGAN